MTIYNVNIPKIFPKFLLLNVMKILPGIYQNKTKVLGELIN